MVGGSSRLPMLAPRLTELLGKTPRLTDPDLAVAKGAALRAHHLVKSTQLSALRARARSSAQASASGGAERVGQVVPVTPRAVGILVEDSFDPSGKRSFVEHLVVANTRFRSRGPRNGSAPSWRIRSRSASRYTSRPGRPPRPRWGTTAASSTAS